MGPKAFTLGVETESRKNMLMFRGQYMTRPQLQKLGPPRMEGKFMALGPFPNFNKMWFFIKVLFWQDIGTGGWIGNWTTLLGPLFLWLLLFLSFSIFLYLYTTALTLWPWGLYTRSRAPGYIIIKMTTWGRPWGHWGSNLDWNGHNFLMTSTPSVSHSLSISAIIKSDWLDI